MTEESAITETPDATVEALVLPDSDTFRRCIPRGYRTTHLGKHEAHHPLTIRRILDSVAGTEAGDLIAWLTWWNCLTAQTAEQNHAEFRRQLDAAEDALSTLTGARHE